jgi:hypothetical protein
MKFSHRALALGVLLVGLALTAVGCSYTQGAKRPMDTSFIKVGQTTKEQVYQKLGLPDTLFFPGYPIKERKWYYKAPPNPNLNTTGEGAEVASALLYSPWEGKGMGIGLGSIATLLFSFGHHHVVSETVLVLMDDQNRVLGVHQFGEAEDIATQRMWPWGK